MVRSLGGVVARVRRGDEPAWYIDAFMLNQRQGFRHDNRTVQHFPERLRGVHVSEWAWIGYPMDSLIDNNTTLDALFERADSLVR
ncbi:MAG: hypothetical protein EON55_12750 [Alphaproteobacteria bacterium]|nr:MAG: hypothetical protein EON55_12750 [Alphaproteobacteria bacterium]